METAVLGLRVLVSLGVVLGLLWWLQRRLVKGGKSSGTEFPVQVLSRQAITPKASVVLVEAAGQRFLLGVTEASVNVLHTAEITDAPAPDTDFAKSLHAAAGREPLNAPFPDGALPGRRETRRTDAGNGAPLLNGSILSPETWRRTAAVIRRGRVG